MAETLLLPVLRGVIGKAADALVQSITRMCGIDEDREKLERLLVYVSRKLTAAEEKSETDPAIRTWMKALKAVTYKAEDVLDDFRYEALRRQAQGHRSTTNKVLSNFTCENVLLFRLKVSRELKNVLHKIYDLVEEMNQFGLLEQAEVPEVIYRQTHSSLDEFEEIYGRDNEKAEVVELLLDQQHHQTVQVLPIIGMGGLGKTTLVKMVYNDIRIQKHFELKMWHCVSGNFEEQCLVRCVIQLATKDSCDLPDNIELLRGKLVDVIGQKRFLLILDDVWNEDEYKWNDHLRSLLCSSIGGSGSMIVVTCRSQNVASIMGTLPTCELPCLSEDDSWKLFSKKAFSKGVQEKKELVTVGRRIIDKCKGLPLALKTMGGLMSSKQAVEEWVAIADSNIGDTSRGKNDVLSVLKLSYRHLSSEMKQCFAFCAIFPKDYVMEKDMLIQLWMANDFIHSEGMMDLTQKGEFIFNELVWRSFLLPDVKEFDVTYAFGGFFYEHLTNWCKMHDLMHDLAKDAAQECASIEELTQKKVSVKDVYHIKMSSYELREIKGVLKRASTLRTLLTEARYQDIKEMKLKSVRALCCREPSHCLVKSSKYLQYLDLSGSYIVMLPDSICKLYNLQTLKLNDCNFLQYLPKGLATNLRKLMHIYLSRCYNLKEMPPKLSLLHNLHILTRFVVGAKDGCRIEELKDLHQLGNRLELCELRKVKSGSKANLYDKHNLCELLLNWNHDASDIRANGEINNDEEILDTLVPPSKIKLLEIYRYHGLEISKWMRDPQMFRCLRTLRISDWPRCKDIPLIWLSPSLEELHLANMDNLTTLCKSMDEDAGHSKQIFPQLMSMTLGGLPNLVRWIEEPDSFVMFPRLVKLLIFGCPKLATLPESPLLRFLSCRMFMIGTCDNYSSEVFIPMNMRLAAWPSLVCLDVGLLAHVDASLEEQQGQSPIISETLKDLCTDGDDAFKSIFNIPKLKLGLGGSLACVKSLCISCVCNIVSWPMEELGYLPRLKCLHILECKKLGEKGLSSDEVIPLPLLTDLIIRRCDCLLEIPRLPPSLETLDIYECERLVALPDGKLTSLEKLKIYHCKIYHCPRIEGFPEGLLQRLPTLKSLEIKGCPDLQIRCREGGEYFDLVSSVPENDVKPEPWEI